MTDSPTRNFFASQEFKDIVTKCKSRFAKEDPDVVHDAIVGVTLKILSGRVSLSQVKSVETYFNTAIKWALIDEYRRKSRTGELKNDLDKFVDAESKDPAEVVVQEELIDRFWSELKKQDETSRQVVIMRLSGMTYKEVGKQLSVSEQRARRTFASALSAMKLRYPR